MKATGIFVFQSLADGRRDSLQSRSAHSLQVPLNLSFFPFSFFFLLYSLAFFLSVCVYVDLFVLSYYIIRRCCRHRRAYFYFYSRFKKTARHPIGFWGFFFRRHTHTMCVFCISLYPTGPAVPGDCD